MQKFTKLLLPVAISSVLVACGGGGGGGGSSDPVAPTSNSTVSGTASKGIIVGGIVNVYPIVNGEVDDTNSLGTATTDENGEYSIDLDPSYDGSPIVVRITPAEDGTSVMKCDLSSCGNGIDFGGDYPLTDDTFSLEAVLPEAEDGEVSVNVTPLTDIAAQVTQDRLAADDSLDPAAVADAANSQVADRFGLTGDITEMPVVDLTDPVAVASADADEVTYASLGAAIATAVQADQAGTSPVTIEEALEQFAEDFSEQGVSGNSTADGVTALDEILQASLDVLEDAEDAAEAAGTQVDLSDAIAGITTDKNNAEQETADTPSQGTPSPTAGSAELVQVKALISDLRNLSNAVSLASLDSTNSANVDAFADELEAAEAVVSENSEVVLEAMALVIEAMGAAFDALEEDATLTSFQSDDGVTVSITADPNNGATLAVDQVVNVDEYGVNASTGVEEVVSTTPVTVDMTGVVTAFAATESETGQEPPSAEELASTAGGGVTNSGSEYTSRETVTMDVALTGSAETALVRVTISEGTAEADITVSETGNWSYVDSSVPGQTLDIAYSDQSTETMMGGIALDLDVTLEDFSDSMITFTGNLSASLQGVDSTEVSSRTFDWEIVEGQGDTQTNRDTYDLSEEFTTVSFGMSGEFSNATGDSFAASLSVTGDATGIDFINDEEYTWGRDCNAAGECTYPYSDSDVSTGETAENFADFSFSLSFTSDLDGVTDALEVTVSGDRTGLKDGTADLTLAYGGRRIEFEADSTAKTLTITNQDSVVISLEENTVEGEEVVSGTVAVGETEYATIGEESLGTMIRYNDGTGESL